MEVNGVSDAPATTPALKAGAEVEAGESSQAPAVAGAEPATAREPVKPKKRKRHEDEPAIAEAGESKKSKLHEQEAAAPEAVEAKKRKRPEGETADERAERKRKKKEKKEKRKTKKEESDDDSE